LADHLSQTVRDLGQGDKGGALRETWQGVFGEVRFQKRLCKLLLKSRFLKAKFKRCPIAAEIVAQWEGPEDLFARIDSCHSSRANTFDLFRDIVPINGKGILDLGCGEAGLSCKYAGSGAEWVVGCDRNYEGWPLENAKGYVRYKGHWGKVLLVQGDGARLPFKAHSFDLIISNDVFDHIIELSEALQECYRVLKPGGQVVITFIPWYHPSGFHLMDYICIPYANLLFNEKVLLDVLLDLAAENPRIADSIPGLKGNPPPTSFDEMGLVLSRVTVIKFRKILQGTKFRVAYLELTGFDQKTKNPVLRAVLDSLTKIPLINELFTSHIDCILEKPTAPSSTLPSTPRGLRPGQRETS